MMTRTTQQAIQRADEARMGWVWSVDAERGLEYAAGSCPRALFAVNGTTAKRPHQPSQALRSIPRRAPS